MIRSVFKLIYSPIDLVAAVILATWWNAPPATVIAVCLIVVPLVLSFVGAMFGVTPATDRYHLMNWQEYSAKYPDAVETMYEGYLRERGHGNLPWGTPK